MQYTICSAKIRLYDDIYSAFSGETPTQKLANARAQARRLAVETGEPYVTIEWSEGSDSFPGLKENEIYNAQQLHVYHVGAVVGIRR